MKTTYYIPKDNTVLKVFRATTAIAKIRLAGIASSGGFCKAVDPKTAKKMIKDGAELIKVQDIY